MTRLLSSARHRTYLLAVALLFCVAFGAAGGVYWRAMRAVRGAQADVAASKVVRFVSRPLLPVTDSGFEPVSAPTAFAQAAEFRGRLYLGGPAGLFEYDAQGRPLREFRVGRELPPSPLLKLGCGTLADSPAPELLIATSDAGILAFDGQTFRQILPEAAEARTITSILPQASGHLLIGTAKRGVLVYDGRRLATFHDSLAGVHVTDLAGTETDLWVGTQDSGVAHYYGGTTEWFGAQNALPDPRVYAIATEGDRAFVGTANGIAEFDRGRFKRVLAEGAFIRALLIRGDTLLAGTMDDGVIAMALARPSRNLRQLNSLAELTEIEQLFASGDALYAVSHAGVFRHGRGEWKRVLEPANALLADRNISALATDRSGHIWIGYFDHGLDVVDTNGQRARHIEDDHVFCINRILPDAVHGDTAVATANGMVLFDRTGARRQVIGRAEGLIADHVTDITRYGDGLAVATPAGLTFIDSDGFHSLYAFHGLVNNHVYAVAANGRQLLAGTLGGASLLQDDQVRASYTTATSRLKHNWITAVVPLENAWWIGTYGGGVMQMDASGRVEPSNGATGDLVINPNAMLPTDRLLLAGTQGHGLYVADRGSGRWMQVTAGLPSLNVTALAAFNGYVYVGTDNGLVRIAEQRLMR